MQSEGQTFERIFHNYTLDDGLPSSQIYQIIQDQKGYIWFGTDRGVVRFNGFEFEVFTNKHGLASNVIFYLTQDDEGTIYTFSKNHDLHYFENGAFVRHPMYNQVKAQIDSRQIPTSLIWDEELIINFYCFADLMNVVMYVSAHEVKFKEIDFIQNHYCGIDLEVHQNGEVGASSLQLMTGEKQHGDVFVLSNEQRLGFKLEYNSNNLLVRSVEWNDQLYFTIFNSLYTLKPQGEVEELFRFPSRAIELERNGSGNLMIGTNEGLWEYHLKDKSAKLVLECGAVASFYEDKSGGWWIGSLYKGLFYQPSNPVHHYKPEKAQVITHFSFQDNGFIYLTDEKEIISYCNNGKMNYPTVTHTPHTARLFERLNDSLVLYLAGINEGLIINTQAKKSQYFLESYQGTYSDFIHTPEGFLGINHINLHWFDSSFGLIRQFENARGVKFSGVDYQKNQIFLSSEDGAYIFDDSLIPYKHERSFYQGILRDVLNVGDSVLAFASEQSGIVIEYEGSTFAFNKSNGLVSDDVRKLRKGENYLLALTKEGLNCINTSGIYRITTRNGLLSNDVFDAHEKGGTLWVLTNEGIQWMKLDLHKREESPVLIPTLKTSKRSIPFSDEIRIGAFEEQLTFEVDVLDYSLKKEVQVAYQLVGIDQDWRYTTERTINYPKIPAGSYAFNLRYQKVGGQWTTPQTLFVIHKATPFYAQWWFIVICLLGIVYLVYRLVQRRIGIIRKKATDKYNLLDLERRALQSQMNPHFVFNCLTSIQALIVEEKYEEANKYLVKFAKLTRTALNHTTRKFVDLQDELQLVQHYVELEQMRFSKEFGFEIKMEDVSAKILVPPTVIQPFVENAILHGLIGLKEREGKLTISLSLLDNKHLRCVIEDNGIGRSADKKSIHAGKSMGVRLIEERLNLLSDIKENTVNIIDKFSGEKALGTIVELKIPIIKYEGTNH